MTLQLDLPPPSSRQYTERSFRKLLKTCFDIVNGDSRGKAELSHWSTSPLFKHYLETLEDQIRELESNTTDGVEEGVLRTYKGHVARLQTELQQQEAVAKLAKIAAQDAAQECDNRAALFSRLQNEDAEPSQQHGPGNAEPLTQAARQKLETQGHLQEMLTDELVGMSAGLKRNTLAMESHLQQRKGLLDETETALESSLANARKSKQRAKEVKNRQRIGFCKTCLSLLLVGCVFLGMYLFIRTTYTFGFKQ